MSAFRVDHFHINALVNAGASPYFATDQHLTFYHKGILHRLDAMGAHEIGTALIDLNNLSVNYHYSEVEEPEPFVFARIDIGAFAPVSILSMINGYRYQACEAPHWEDSLAASYLNALEAAAIRRLPGYDDGPWHLTEATYREMRANN